MPRPAPPDNSRLSASLSETKSKQVYQHSAAQAAGYLEHRLSSLEQKSQSKALASFHSTKSAFARDLDADLSDIDHKLRDHSAWIKNVQDQVQAPKKLSKCAPEPQDDECKWMQAIDQSNVQLRNLEERLNDIFKEYPTSNALTAFINDVNNKIKKHDKSIKKISEQTPEHQQQPRATVSQMSTDLQSLQQYSEEVKGELATVHSFIEEATQTHGDIEDRFAHADIMLKQISTHLLLDVNQAGCVGDNTQNSSRIDKLEAQLNTLLDQDNQHKKNNSLLLTRVNELEIQIRKMQAARKSADDSAKGSVSNKQYDKLLQVLQTKQSQIKEATDARLKKLEETMKPYEQYESGVKGSVEGLAKMQNMVKDFKLDSSEVMRAVNELRNDVMTRIGLNDNDIQVLTRWVQALQENERARPNGDLSTAALAQSLVDRLLRGETIAMDAMKSLHNALQVAIARAGETVQASRLPQTPEDSVDAQAEIEPIDVEMVEAQEVELAADADEPAMKRPRVETQAADNTTRKGKEKIARTSLAKEQLSRTPKQVKMEPDCDADDSTASPSTTRKRRRTAGSMSRSEHEIRRTSRTHIPTKRGEEYMAENSRRRS